MSHFVAFYRWIRYCGFNVAFIIFKFHLKPLTRRLAACTQAVVILRSTSYIAIELKCSVFEVVRNSIESMCSSYSAFDCISWNRLIAYYSFAGPLPRKMSQDRYVSLWTFQSIFLSLCRCCCLFVCLFVCFISQTKETF